MHTSHRRQTQSLPLAHNIHRYVPHMHEQEPNLYAPTTWKISTGARVMCGGRTTDRLSTYNFEKCSHGSHVCEDTFASSPAAHTPLTIYIICTHQPKMIMKIFAQNEQTLPNATVMPGPFLAHGPFHVAFRSRYIVCQPYHNQQCWLEMQSPPKPGPLVGVKKAHRFSSMAHHKLQIFDGVDCWAKIFTPLLDVEFDTFIKLLFTSVKFI